ncbi:hypothetical protein [Streptomyces olivoreticuli]|uniref:hypothetical protein n=1 Tax=Streptomyces olivoreticuli TaxID=68246 RepID=UPI001F071596|nr:hypothetical protein [Streptomyces olivoreticuli]
MADSHRLPFADASFDGTMGIRDWAGVFADRGHLDRSEAHRFDTLVDDAIRAGRFLYAVTYFLTSATLPPADRGDDPR